MKHFVLIRFDMIDNTPTLNYISGKWNGISRWFVTSVVILTYPWHKKMFHQTNPSPNFPSQESLTFLYQRFERKSQFRDLDIRSYLIIWPSLKPPTFSYVHHVVISLYPLIGLRQVCSSQFQYLSNSTKEKTNSETAMLSNRTSKTRGSYFFWQKLLGVLELPKQLKECV